MNDQKFRKTLEAVRASSSRDELAAATSKNLKLLLGHPSDQKLLESLLGQADTITGRLPAGKGETAEIRQAAVRCTVLLETAKKSGKPAPRNRRVLILALAAAAVAVLYAVLLLDHPR